MPFNRNKINRKTADPEILDAYERMRYERRYPKLGMGINIFRLCAYLGITPVFFIDEDLRWPWAKVWMVVVAIAVVMELALMIAWQPRGQRLKAFCLLVASLAVVAGLFAAFIFVMDKWMASL